MSKPDYCNGGFRKDCKEKKNCPRCGGSLPTKYQGVLSRRDNETEICFACVLAEGMEDFQKRIEPTNLKKYALT